MLTVNVFHTSAGRRVVAHQPIIAASAVARCGSPGPAPKVSTLNTAATIDRRCQLHRCKRLQLCAFMVSPFVNAPPASRSTARLAEFEAETSSETDCLPL